MKKFLAVVMALAMVFSFAACGGKKGGHADNELYVGAIGAATGDYAVYGLAVKYGAEIAVDEINAAGGVNGMKIVFDFQDSQGDPESAKSAYGKLMDWGMDISIGTVMSGEMASVTAESANDDMFMISPSASNDTCISASSNAFRVCFYDSFQGTAAADYVKATLSGKKVAVFYQSDNDYSIGLYDAFKAQAAVNGTEIVAEQSFTSDEKDFTTQINTLADSKAEVVFLPIYAAEASMFLSQAKNGTDNAVFAEGVYFFGCDGLDGILEVVDNVSTANNVVMLTPFAASSTDADVVSFVEAYKAKTGGTVPNQFAADGYDAVYVIKAALEAMGVSKSSEVSGAKVAEAMTSLSYSGVTGDMTWTADGNTQKLATAVIYNDGVDTEFGK
ncbi:MAG: ABC transporter substrate-binding protein [Firmicutes bacterium]|nr:ABC transporter substrate-binding protein [Bacillota bacterium]